MNYMQKKLYVGNLSYSVDDKQLGDFFSSAGTVASAKVIADNETGRSRGFGFVEMSSEENHQKAIRMNGLKLDGRALKINEAKPKSDRPQFGGFRKRSRY